MNVKANGYPHDLTTSDTLVRSRFQALRFVMRDRTIAAPRSVAALTRLEAAFEIAAAIALRALWILALRFATAGMTVAFVLDD